MLVVVHWLRLLMTAAFLRRLLLLLMDSVLQPKLIVILLPLGILSQSLLLEVSGAFSVLLYLLYEVAKLRGFEEP